jgi:hypothetical protein
MDVLFGLAVVVLSGIGAALGTMLKEYFASRGRKEGEIDAIKRNLDEVLRQQRETTRVTEEIRDAVSRQLTHDRELFARYEHLLPESCLRDALNGDLYAKRSDTRFTGRLSDVIHLARSEGGQFLCEPVEGAFIAYREKIGELAVFIATHFFTPTIGQLPDGDGYHSLELYPEYRHKPPKPGSPDWDARASELDDLCESVELAYIGFRRCVKEHLAV